MDLFVVESVLDYTNRAVLSLYLTVVYPIKYLNLKKGGKGFRLYVLPPSVPHAPFIFPSTMLWYTRTILRSKAKEGQGFRLCVLPHIPSPVPHASFVFPSTILWYTRQILMFKVKEGHGARFCVTPPPPLFFSSTFVDVIVF